jgi:hypothetical protein
LSSSCSPSSTITTISVLISMVGSRGTLAYAIYGGQFATLIEHFAPHQAITLGGLRPDLPNEVSVTTKRKLSNRSARQIPRCSDERAHGSRDHRQERRPADQTDIAGS